MILPSTGSPPATHRWLNTLTSSAYNWQKQQQQQQKTKKTTTKSHQEEIEHVLLLEFWKAPKQSEREGEKNTSRPTNICDHTIRIETDVPRCTSLHFIFLLFLFSLDIWVSSHFLSVSCIGRWNPMTCLKENRMGTAGGEGKGVGGLASFVKSEGNTRMVNGKA